MTKGQKFRAAAQKVIKKFAKEKGLSTLYFLDADVAEDDYDVTTGVVTSEYTEHESYMAFDEIWTGETILGNRFIALDPGYIKDNRIAYIAGADIAVVPISGCLIKPAGETGRHKIDYVVPDMYGALYTCFITRVPLDDVLI